MKGRGKGGRGLTYFLEPNFLARGQVNLIAGSSGSGKSTLIFQMYKSLMAQEPFLGMNWTHEVKWAYISGDRTTASAQEAQDRVGVTFPIFSLVDHDLIGKDLIEHVMPRLPPFYGYKPNLVIVEGFSSMMPKGNSIDYANVCKWLARCQRYCWALDLSILGICHFAKSKENAMYADPRDKIMGSNAFSGYTEDIIVIEKLLGKKCKDPSKRLVHLLRRNGSEVKLQMQFEDGVLAIDEGYEERKREEASAVSQGVAFVLADLLVPGAVLETSAMENYAAQHKISRRTFYRWTHYAMQRGLIKKTDHGEYQVIAKEAEDVFKTYEEFKAGRNTQAAAVLESPGETQGIGIAGSGPQGDRSQEEVRQELSQEADDLERGIDDAEVVDARFPKDEDQVRGDGRGREVSETQRAYADGEEDSDGRPGDEDSGEGAGDGD